ncbi:lithostathine-1-alpha-like [Mytilus trossulus]|uniref:lithostathine-1-alpha-like n=1 Tax=Mytilus trossulus TaxID=6551 RepID=UPI0030049022
METVLLFLSFLVVLLEANVIFNKDDLTRCPPILPRNSNLFAYIDTCFEIVHDEHSWNDARGHCQQHGGDLVVIKDLTKQQFVMNALKYLRWDKKGVWIGGTDADKEGEWKWVTGEKMTWGYWQHGQGVTQTGFLFAKGTFEDCAQIRVNDGYKWHDFPCSGGPAYHYSSICEYKMPKMLTSSTTGTNVETPVPTTMAKTQTSTATTLAKIETPAPTVLPNVETPAPTVLPNVETPAPTVLPNVETPAPTLTNVETPAPYKPTSAFTTRIITNPPGAGVVNKETVIIG